MRDSHNLGDLIDRGADGLRPAVIDLSGERVREIGFAALADRAVAVARGLQAAGLERGERVALLASNSSEYLAAYLGAMQAGLVAVPVNYRFPRELVEFVLRDSQARLVFCDEARRSLCPDALPKVLLDAADPSDRDSGARTDAAPRGKLTPFGAFIDPGPFEAIEPAPREPAMFLYTSGSTGRPKGVVLSHQSHLWVVRTRLQGQALDAHRFLIAAPLYHMNALALAKLVLAGSATMVLLPQFESASYAQAIESHRCTWLTAVPPMIAMMLREPGLVEATDFSSVQVLRMGSAPVSPALLEAIRRVMPQVQIINGYGSTEAGPVAFGAHPDGLPTPSLSVGYPHPAVALRLVADGDADARQGELQVQCPGMMNGYHNRPDLKPPFTADGFYASGDVFRRDEQGFHYFVGRIDDMFVCGGENVYPGEVEKLLETHPGIAQACVVPIDDDTKGQKPVAFCVPRAGAMLDEDEVKRFAIEHAPAFRHPRRVWFVERLPLTTTSKIDRKGLRERALATPSSAS